MVGQANILVEHGNIFDKFNRIDYAGLHKALALTSRGFTIDVKNYYTPPFGSKLVLDHVIPIRKQFPWLDYLEPGTEAVYILMRELTTIRHRISFLRSIKDFLWTIGEDEITKFRTTWNPQLAYRKGVDDAFIKWLNTELEKQTQPFRFLCF